MPAPDSGRTVRDVPLAKIIVGAHGAFAELVFSLTDEIARTNGIGTLRIDRSDVVDFSAAPNQILLCNYPSNQIVATIARGDLQVLFLSEPAAETLLFMQHNLGVEPLEAIRSQTASAVANLVIGQCSSVRYLDRNSGLTMVQLADRLVEFLGIAIAPEQRRALTSHASAGLGSEAGIQEVLAKHAESWPKDGAKSTRIPECARLWTDVCHDVVDGVLAMARFGSQRPIVWPTEVFSLTAPRLLADPAAVALAGPSRNIYYGPYFYLPPSRYRVEIFLRFSDDTSQVPFSLEVHAGAWLSRTRIASWRPGRLRGAFHLVHSDATSALEIRLRNLTEIAQGTLSLVEVLFFAEINESS